MAYFQVYSKNIYNFPIAILNSLNMCINVDNHNIFRERKYLLNGRVYLCKPGIYIREIHFVSAHSVSK